MNSFPNRNQNHIKETSSWKIFEGMIHSNWIVRQLTERDYGVDAYIEIVNNNGEIAGDICFIQLKSSDRINWEHGQKKLSGIKKSTINYWLNLPAPVYIFWVDLSKSRLFFSPVKEVIRNTYKEFLKGSETMSIPFNEKDEFGTELGEIRFIVNYFNEKEFPDIVNLLRLLIIHSKEYYDFIISNQGRDYFLQVEEERQIKLVHLYNLCKTLANFYLLKWNVTKLDSLYKKDSEMWDDGYDLHENSLSLILSELEDVFIQILELSKEIITNYQKDFWKKEFRLIYSMYKKLDVENIKLDIY